jgi:hypothetical protein
MKDLFSRKLVEPFNNGIKVGKVIKARRPEGRGVGLARPF